MELLKTGAKLLFFRECRKKVCSRFTEVCNRFTLFLTGVGNTATLQQKQPQLCGTAQHKE